MPADRLWGAQTQRSLDELSASASNDFAGDAPVIRAFGIVKKCAALANGELGQLPVKKSTLIVRAAQEVIDGAWDRRISSGRFPDRLRHAVQHERERGDRQSRDAARWRPRKRFIPTTM